jgi:predicted small secreted protein
MKTIVYAVFASALLFLTACNTVKGVGQDVQKVGEKIEGASKK